MDTKNTGRRGFTLIEVTLSLTLATVIGSVILMGGQTMGSAFRTTSSVMTVEEQARRAVDRVANLLETAGVAELVPPVVQPPGSADSIQFRRPVGYDLGAIVWGSPERIELEPSPEDPDDGIDNDGDGLVDERRLVWTEDVGTVDERRHVIAPVVSEALEGEDPNNLADDNGNGLEDESGFNIVHDGAGRLTIRITVARRVTAGIVLSRTVERTIALEN